MIFDHDFQQTFESSINIGPIHQVLLKVLISLANKDSSSGAKHVKISDFQPIISDKHVFQQAHFSFSVNNRNRTTPVTFILLQPEVVQKNFPGAIGEFGFLSIFH